MDDQPVKTSANTSEYENHGEEAQSPLQEKLNPDVAVVTVPTIEKQEGIESISPKKPKKRNGAKVPATSSTLEFEKSPSAQQIEENVVTAEAPLVNDVSKTENQEGQAQLVDTPKSLKFENVESLSSPSDTTTAETPPMVGEMETPSNTPKKDHRVKASAKTISTTPESKKESGTKNKDKLPEKRITLKAGVTESVKTTPDSRLELENQNLDKPQQQEEDKIEVKNPPITENMSDNGPEKEQGLQKILDGILNPSKLKQQLNKLITPVGSESNNLPKMNKKDQPTKDLPSLESESAPSQVTRKVKSGAPKSSEKLLPTSETLPNVPEFVSRQDNTSPQTTEEAIGLLPEANNVPVKMDPIEGMLGAEGIPSIPEFENPPGSRETEARNMEPDRDNMDSFLQIPDDTPKRQAETRSDSSEAPLSTTEKEEPGNTSKSNEKTIVDPTAKTSSDENQGSEATRKMEPLATAPPVLEDIPSMFVYIG
jgi:hypothetical protein